MSIGHSPIVRRRRFGAELHALREQARLTAVELGAKLGWSESKVSRLENARVRPNVGDVMDLLDVLGVTDATKREQLIALARDAATTRGWWSAYDGDIDKRQIMSAELENGAVQIREFQPMLVPGLLQCREYAYARFASRSMLGLPLINVDAAVDARLARQDILTRDAPLEYQALLDEALLVRRCGPPGARRAQLAHLVKLAELPAVTLRVLPYDAEIEGHYIPPCGFALFRFADPVDPELITLETETSDLHLGDEEDLDRYKASYDQMWQAAFSPEDSVSLLTAARDDQEEEP